MFVTAKNVAADISEKLCDSVAAKLEGKTLGTFGSKFWPRGYKTFFMLSSAEHESFSAYKYENAS